MALPTYDCGVSDPTSACCTMLFIIGTNIMHTALEAVQRCMASTPCGSNELIGYVSVGQEIQDPVPDYLVVSLAWAGHSPGAQGPNGNRFINLMRATYQVRLIESGWPQPSGDGESVIFPHPDEYMNAGLHSYAHGESMYRALVSSKDLNPYCSTDCYTHFEPLRPVEPAGGTVGWETFITTDYPMSAPQIAIV